MIGGHRSITFDQPRLPIRVMAPLADVDFNPDTQPDGVAVVLVAAFQI